MLGNKEDTILRSLIRRHTCFLMGIIISPEKLIIERNQVFSGDQFLRKREVVTLRANLGGSSGGGAGKMVALSPEQEAVTRALGGEVTSLMGSAPRGRW